MLASELVAFAKQYRSTGCILIASHDQGFASTLRWSKVVGCTTLTLSQHPGKKRFSSIKGPGEFNLRPFELSVVCHVCGHFLVTTIRQCLVL